jgi:CobQ-like glutamine amidotransferase family enzyme
MKRILLISNSTLYGSGYLDHAEGEIRSFLGDLKRVLFVPFALYDRDKYAATAKQRFAKMGYEVSSIHTADDAVQAVNDTDAVFIGGGNTFRLLKALYDFALLGPIRDRVAAGMPYIGSSAGSNVAGPTIRTTNDMPIRPTTILRCTRFGFVSNQPSLRRPRSEFATHGRDARRANSSIPGRERHAGRRPARRRHAADRKRRDDLARLNGRQNIP